ncbi:hypothetical protein TNCV_467981 [Trichonephila clavipes]|nr:hypothetical protein TNCV_467981 [Trichonephila clavipes]
MIKDRNQKATSSEQTKLGCITNLTIKQQSSERKHPSSPTPKKAKTVKLAVKWFCARIMYMTETLWVVLLDMSHLRFTYDSRPVRVVGKPNSSQL